MASGDTLCVFKPQDAEITSTPCGFDARNYHPILTFDAATTETAVFSTVMPRHYASGGVNARVAWAAASATSGNVVLEGSFERLQDDAQDMDADSFASAQSVTDGAASAAGELSYVDITFTDGAQIDSVAVGEGFRFKIARIGGSGSDTMSGDAQIRFIELRET